MGTYVLYDGATSPFSSRTDVREEIRSIRAIIARHGDDLAPESRRDLERAVEDRERWIREATVRAFRADDGTEWVAFEMGGQLTFRRSRPPDLVLNEHARLHELEDEDLAALVRAHGTRTDDRSGTTGGTSANNLPEAEEDDAV